MKFCGVSPAAADGRFFAGGGGGEKNRRSFFSADDCNLTESVI